MAVRSRIVIIGAGPTGLGAAYELQRLGFDDWALYEREDVVGGLARSFHDGHGFTWDVGVHVTHSHYDAFSDVLDNLWDASGWIHHERRSWVRVLDTWVPYPFQYNLHRLPPDACEACLAGLERAAGEASARAFRDFDDFIVRTFGEGVAELFMRPYNRKIWACDPSEMAAGWIADRVPVPDAERVRRNVELRRDDTGWGPNNTFRFPARGGTGAIWQAVAAKLPAEKLHLGCEVVRLDADSHTLTLTGGSRVPYDTLISSIPLDQLARISGRPAWIDLASRLAHTSTHVIGVALEGTAPAELETKCWVYCPEDNCPFYRVTHFSLYSPHNVDDAARHWSVICEVAESPERRVDAETVADDCIRGLVASGMIDSAERVHHTWMRRFEYGYPTPTLGRDEVLGALLPELAQAGVLSRGRFGAWKYEVGNMDHSFMQGVEAARHVAQGEDEVTVWNPALVNTGKSPTRNG